MALNATLFDISEGTLIREKTFPPSSGFLVQNENRTDSGWDMVKNVQKLSKLGVER